MQESEDPVVNLRHKKQADIECQREKRRQDLLSPFRTNISNAEIFNDVTHSQFTELIQDLNRKGKKLDLETLKKIKHSCCRSEFTEAFFKINGAVDSLTSCLKTNDAQIQLEAICCFTNLACGTHKLCFRVARAVGAYLVSFMTGGSHFLQTQCAWAVRNIVNDCIECYSVLKAQGVFPALLKAFMSPIPDVIESTIYALNGCLKYGDIDLVDINKEEYSNRLLKLIDERTLSQNTIREAAFVLSNSLYIAAGSNYDCNNFDLPKLLKSLDTLIEKDYLTALILIRCLGYLSIYNEIADYLFTSDPFHKILFQVMSHTSHILKQEIFWVLTNISANHLIETDHCLFMPILKEMGVFLSPLSSSSAVLLVLYYICCTASQSQNVRSSYHNEGIVKRIKNLTTCGNLSIENASKSCLSVIENSV